MTALLIIIAVLLGYVAYRLILREGGIFLGPYEFKFRKDPGPDEFLQRLKELQQRKQDFESRLVLSAATSKFPNNIEFFRLAMDKVFTDLKTAQTEKEVEEIFTRGESLIKEFGAASGTDSISLLTEYSKRLVQAQEEFYSLRKERDLEIERRQRERNEEILKELENILEGIRASNDEMAIRDAMNNAARLETGMDLSLVDESQNERYRDVKNGFYKMAEEKVESLRSARYSRYNRKAIERLKKLLDEFTENEKELSKSGSSLPVTLKEYIGTLNTSYFDGPTMQYFNYVYGYIFSLIDEDLKFEVTRIMAETEKDTLDI
jgi:1,2-phenylacetyl-CoA epoxidase PaaB subunit